MKKILACLMAALLVLSGCGGASRSSEQERAQRYASYISSIETQTDFQTSSEYFDISMTLTALSSGQYRYDVMIENPRVAMYNVQVLCIPRDETGTLLTKESLPNAGILEEDSYNLIPNQVNVEKGFPGGIDVSGLTDLSPLSVVVLVVWNGYAMLAENREYFELRAEAAPAEESTEGADE